MQEGCEKVVQIYFGHCQGMCTTINESEMSFNSETDIRSCYSFLEKNVQHHVYPELNILQCFGKELYIH